jgi:hypothetical protein
MKKLDLTGWAAIAEIVGTAAVVVSLLVVAQSVNRNIAVLQAANDNFLYQLQDGRNADIVRETELASIFVKHSNNEQLSDVEKLRFIKHQLREIAMWELAYDRHNEGLFPSDKWSNWNSMFATDMAELFPEEWWADLRLRFGDDFARHVDAVYSNK